MQSIEDSKIALQNATNEYRVAVKKLEIAQAEFRAADEKLGELLEKDTMLRHGVVAAGKRGRRTTKRRRSTRRRRSL
jgi:hypothetical protein